MRILTVAAVALVAGCVTNGKATRGVTLITSEPTGALVTVEGYGECETPCSVEADAVRSVTVAKAGFLPVRFDLVPGKKRVALKLELAAPTEGVDEGELPEL